MTMGLETDIDAAMRRCAADSPSILASARSNPDPNVANLAPFVGNFTWQALKSIDTLDDPAREMVMSIVGALIFPRRRRAATRTTSARASRPSRNSCTASPTPAAATSTCSC